MLEPPLNQEFLMEQWIERINTFLPDMKVGKVQRNKVEIDGYDISLAMLKSLSMRDYPKDTFKDVSRRFLRARDILSYVLFKTFLLNCKYGSFL